MLAHKSIVLVYFYSLLAVAVSAWIGVSVQDLLRLPVVNARLIDVVLVVNFGISAVAFWNYWIGGARATHRKLDLLQKLIILYLLFETVQLARTLGAIDVQAQASYFVATLCMLIILYFSIEDVTPGVHEFVLWASFTGACTVIIIVAMQLFGLATGFAYSGQWERVEFDVLGGKETISNSVLIPLVLTHSVIVHELQLSGVKKVVYRIAFAALFINLVFVVVRGLLAMWAAVLFFFVPFARKRSVKSLTRTVVSIVVIGGLTFLFLGDTLTTLGYNPLVKLQETFGYATDVDNPGWDKGRGFAQAAALSVWLDHFWLGTGYDEVSNIVDVDISPHNGLITSLFHRGVLGTAILFSIILMCFGRSIKLWKQSRDLAVREQLLNRSLVFVAWLWLIPFITQDMLWERYSLSIQFIYFGIIVGLERYYRTNVSTAGAGR